MNNISIFNCEVIAYSSEEPNGFVLKENEKGIYAMFRCLEPKFNAQPVCWFVQADGNLAQRIKNMKIAPGDILNLTGEVYTYKDMKRKKDSYKLLLERIDYGVKKKTTESTSATEQKDEPKSSETIEDIIKRNEDEIFVKNINLS